ncbi:MAG: hypothetical protein ACYC61_12645 [Isosphaeraceae bacterium]
MTRVLYDDVLKAKLPDLSGPIELCDENGNVLALLEPVREPDEERLCREPQISREELLWRQANPGKLYTTEEVLAYLESL